MSNIKDRLNKDLKWIVETLKTDQYTIYGAISKLENCMIFIISKDGFRFGSLAISVPSIRNENSHYPSSTTIPIIFGKKNEILSRALSERVCYKTNQLVISIVNIDEKNQNMVKDCITLINKLLDKIK